jgi:hypothetical protein
MSEPAVGDFLEHPVTGSIWEVVEIDRTVPQCPPTIHLMNLRSQASLYGYPRAYEKWKTVLR